MKGRLVRALGVLAIGFGAALLADEARVACKARLAEVLIDRALLAHLADGKRHRPWPWADTAPLALLEAPRLGLSRTILAGASGTSLAFGAGHVDGSAPLNAEGHAVIAGHRDGAFRFLGELRLGDRLRLRTPGREQRYEVVDIRVVPESATWLLDPAGPTRVTLLTCWPLDGLGPSRERLAVSARLVTEEGLDLDQGRLSAHGIRSP